MSARLAVDYLASEVLVGVSGAYLASHCAILHHTAKSAKDTRFSWQGRTHQPGGKEGGA